MGMGVYGSDNQASYLDDKLYCLTMTLLSLTYAKKIQLNEVAHPLDRGCDVASGFQLLGGLILDGRKYQVSVYRLEFQYIHDEDTLIGGLELLPLPVKKGEKGEIFHAYYWALVLFNAIEDSMKDRPPAQVADSKERGERDPSTREEKQVRLLDQAINVLKIRE